MSGYSAWSWRTRSSAAMCPSQRSMIRRIASRRAVALAGRAADGGNDQHLAAGLGADAVDHADAEGGARAVLVDLHVAVRVAVAAHSVLQPVPAVPDEREHQHPAAAQLEVGVA